MYGPDADQMWEAIEPIVGAYSPQMGTGSCVIKQYGADQSETRPEVRLEINSKGA